MSVHVLAIIKGTVEGDPFKHFGALGGFTHYAVIAIGLGLLSGDVDALSPTPAGLSFYRSAGLAALPPGRANQWGDVARGALEALAAVAAEGGQGRG